MSLNFLIKSHMAAATKLDSSPPLPADHTFPKLSCEAPAVALRRKRRRRNWTEFVKTAKSGPSDRQTAAEARDWFEGLSPEERQSCISYEHGWLCFAIIRMFHRKLKDGEGNFSLLDERLASGELDPFQDCFYFQKRDHEALKQGAVLSAETELEGMVRFVDSEDYLDTLTLSSDAAKNPGRLLALMSELTVGRALQTPCMLTWNPYFKMWILDSPGWFSATSFNSLAVWICCALEKAIWLRYWEKVMLEHKRTPEYAASIEYSVGLRYFDELPSLIDYWSSLSRRRRAELTGAYQDLTNDFKRFTLDDFVCERPDHAVYVPNFLNFSQGLFPSNFLPKMNSQAKRKANAFNSESSIRDLLKLADDDNSANFFEFLLLSPLDRAGSRLDRLGRKVAYRIKEALAQKEADDLLVAEKKPAGGMAKKKRPARKHSEDSSSTSASGRVNFSAFEEVEADENYGRKVVSTLLTCIIEGIAEVVPSQTLPKPQPEPHSEEDGGFITVGANKRKPKASVKPKPKKDKAKAKKKKQPKLQKSPPTSKATGHAYVVWESSAPPTSQLNETDFPPLQPLTRANPAYQKLTSELERFYRTISSQVELLKLSRSQLIEKVNSVVNHLFPRSFVQLYGSYATGLAMPWSDIDIVVVNAGVYDDESHIEKIRVLGASLEDSYWARRVIVLDKAAVPVIKLTASGDAFESEEPIEADITFDECTFKPNGNSGIATTMVTHQILSEHSQVAVLCCVVKYLLHKHKLNSAFKGKSYTGGLSSYTITLWVASYLLSVKEQRPSGDHLMGFLDFFGNKFDAKTTAISLQEGGFTPRLAGSYGGVETRDPICLASNTSRGSFNFESIQKLFSQAHARLMQWATVTKPSSLQSLLISL